MALTLLYDFGASPTTTDNYGMTALHISTMRSCMFSTRYLLTLSEAAAMAQAKDSKGRTPLDIAREKGLGVMIGLLDDGTSSAASDATPAAKQLSLWSRLEAGGSGVFSNANHLIQRLSVQSLAQLDQYGLIGRHMSVLGAKAPVTEGEETVSAPAAEPTASAPVGTVISPAAAAPAPAQRPVAAVATMAPLTDQDLD